MDNELVELVISCTSWQKAYALIDELFASKLLLSAEFMPMPSAESTGDNDALQVKVVIMANSPDIAAIKRLIKRAQHTATLTKGVPAFTSAVGSIK